ncbi:MAG: isoprenylcysteine carboxylmethyltransferase family protein [Chloroflexota bacterium]
MQLFFFKTLFGFHLFNEIYKIRSSVLNALGKKGEGYVVIQFILFVLIFLAPNRLSFGENWGSPFSMIGLFVGVVLMIAGGLLAVAGVFNLGTNLTAVPRPKENSQLVQAGAYGLVRHPIYSGIILGALGWGCLNSSLVTIGLAFGLLLFFDIKSRQEEVWLSEKFPEYVDYQRRVKKLLPFIY